jgi:hypothetical protein
MQNDQNPDAQQVNAGIEIEFAIDPEQLRRANEIMQQMQPFDPEAVQDIPLGHALPTPCRCVQFSPSFRLVEGKPVQVQGDLLRHSSQPTLEDGDLAIGSIPSHAELVAELSQALYQLTDAGLILIEGKKEEDSNYGTG